MIAAGVFGERVKRFVTIDYDYLPYTYSIERRSGSAKAALLGNHEWGWEAPTWSGL